MHPTLITIIPSILAVVFLLLFAPKDYTLKGANTPLPEAMKSMKSASGELGVLVGVIAIRSLAYTAMLTMLPLYFKSQNVSNIAASQLVTIMLASGAAVGVIGGFISDFLGRIIGPLFMCYAAANT